MGTLPEFAEKIEVADATVDFYKFIQDGLTTYQFDTSMCGPPDPMVNAMVGLQLLDENSQLIMINHKAPGGLFPRIESDFDYEIGETEDGMSKVTFRKKVGVESSTDFSARTCSG